MYARPQSTLSKTKVVNRFTCDLCGAVLANKKSLDTHSRQVHDRSKNSSQIRTGPLVCEICSREFKTASGLERHISNGHTNVKPGRRTSRVSVPGVSYECDVCHQGFNSIDDFCTHMESHPVAVDVTNDHDKTQTEISSLTSFAKDEVHCTIGSADLGNAILECFDASIGYSSSGMKSVILTPVKSREQVEAGFDSIRVLPRCSEILNISEPQNLDLRRILSRCQYGRLVDDSIYKPVTDGLFNMSFRDECSTIAKMLAGSLLQSNASTVLILKVEIYDCRSTEDIHSLPIAPPASELYVVRVVEHDSCNKLAICTSHWNALVTASIDLASGEPLVGPNQKNILASRASTLYLRDDFKRNTLTERQIRSEFHNPTTYKACSAVFWQFSYFARQPVTLALLLDHYTNKNYSGVKAVAEVFNNIYVQKEQKKYISKEFLDEIINKLAMADSTRSRRRSEQEVDDSFGTVFNCLTGIQRLFSKHQDSILVDQKVDKFLQVLASSALGCIRRLNNKEISNNIKQQATAILNERVNNQ